MESTIEKVAEFHKMTGQPILDTPTIPDKERILLRYSLLREEMEELYEAAMNGDLVGVADALTDLQYVLDGTYLECGMQNIKEPLFDEVQRSNMSKSCISYAEARIEMFDKIDNGTDCHVLEMGENFIIVRNDDLKILKPSTYSPADLKAIVFPE